MSESATIASSNSGGRPALDLTETIPLTRTPNIRLLGGAAASTTTTHESFLLCEKFIYATSCTPATAVYHISTRNTRSGKPWQLALSRLLPSETRLLSSASASTTSPLPLIKYDDDLTLYTGEKLAVPISIGQKPLLCIRGRRAAGSSSSSTIIVEKTLGRSRTYKFWRMTPIRRPLNKAEEERMQALMHKRGYRTSDDWRKELVYTAQQGRAGGAAAAATTEWTDERGVVVARESDGQLMMGGGSEVVEASTRDLLVACWASRNFVQSSRENESAAA